MDANLGADLDRIRDVIGHIAAANATPTNDDDNTWRPTAA